LQFVVTDRATDALGPDGIDRGADSPLPIGGEIEEEEEEEEVKGEGKGPTIYIIYIYNNKF